MVAVGDSRGKLLLTAEGRTVSVGPDVTGKLVGEDVLNKDIEDDGFQEGRKEGLSISVGSKLGNVDGTWLGI